jgi:hypothetical protein
MTGTELATLSADSEMSTGSNVIGRVSVLPWMPRIEEHPAWETLAQLRVTMRVE